MSNETQSPTFAIHLSICENIIPVMDTPPHSIVDQLCKKITSYIVAERSEYVVSKCFKCLSLMVEHHTHNWSYHKEIWRKSYHGIEMSMNNQLKEIGALPRLLFFTGVFIEHVNFKLFFPVLDLRISFVCQLFTIFTQTSY